MTRSVNLHREHERVLDSPLTDWITGELLIRCDCPGRERRGVGFPVRDLEARRPGLLVRAWCGWLRCSLCGRRPDAVAIRIPDDGRGPRPGDLWAPLVGYGTPGHAGGPQPGQDTRRVEWWKPNAGLASPRQAPEMTLLASKAFRRS